MRGAGGVPRRRDARRNSRAGQSVEYTNHNSATASAQPRGLRTLRRPHEWAMVSVSLSRASQRDLCRGPRPYPRVLGADFGRSTRANTTDFGVRQPNTMETVVAGARPPLQMGVATRQPGRRPAGAPRRTARTGGRRPPSPRGARPLLGRASRRRTSGRSPVRPVGSVTGHACGRTSTW
jgi:hypothetical protein